MLQGLRFIFLLLIICGLCYCSSSPPPPPPKEKPRPTGRLGTYKSASNGLGQYNRIDIELLIQELQMEREPASIGYQEKSFDSCAVESNFSRNPKCETLYLGVLNFQMVCRTNDAIVRREDLLPLEYHHIRWKRGYLRGLASTDTQGYGRVQFITDTSSFYRPIIFNMNGRMVFKRLKDQWQMILPNHWCSAGTTASGS